MTARRPVIFAAALVALLAAGTTACNGVDGPTLASFEVEPMAPTDTAGFIPREVPRLP